MKNKNLSITAIVASIILTFPQSAIAAQHKAETIDVALPQILSEYSDTLNKAYYNTTPKTKSQATLSSTAYDQIQDGLIPTNTNITAKTHSIEKTGNGYNLHVDITLSSDLKADSETTIYLAGKPSDSLHSSWTDRHILHIIPDSDSSSGYTITTDKVVDPAETASSSTSPKPTSTPVNDEKTPSSLDRNQSSFDPTKRRLMASRADFGENSDGLNYIKAIQYADKWTEIDEMNPAYPIFDQNCANFVSQAIHEGGKPIHQRLWSYSTSVPSATTRFWMNADGNYTYMKHYTNSFTNLLDVWDAWEGSLLYVDWESDGEIDHTMIVVGVVVKDGKANPVIDQKSGNRHQITLTQSLQYAHNNGHNNMTWYGLQYRYD